MTLTGKTPRYLAGCMVVFRRRHRRVEDPPFESWGMASLKAGLATATVAAVVGLSLTAICARAQSAAPDQVQAKAPAAAPPADQNQVKTAEAGQNQVQGTGQ